MNYLNFLNLYYMAKYIIHYPDNFDIIHNIITIINVIVAPIIKIILKIVYGRIQGIIFALISLNFLQTLCTK